MRGSDLPVGHPAGANYRTVWALNKHFPNVKSYVRAHDVSYGLILEKAGATAVVPETLEPSLQVLLLLSPHRLHRLLWLRRRRVPWERCHPVVLLCCMYPSHRPC